MTTLVITHAVADYDAWKHVFDEHAASRKEHGCAAEELFRDPDQPGTVMNLMRYPSLEAAQAFLADPSLREAMGRAGVVGQPRIEFWDSIQAVDF
ncbi:MAG TPA: antibiotic biosynthesis monooxygenase [Actinomycetota bacterium]|nr:antibiotic biosynthesis monooxygenase [Actinomycetota bacterium]